MRKVRVLLVAILTSLVVGGCGTMIESKVTVFHEIAPNAQGKTYAFVRSKQQEGSLEHKTYEDLEVIRK